LKPGRASRTAEAIAAIRAAETHRPEGERLFADPFAQGFLGPVFRTIVALSRLPWVRAILLHWVYDRRLPGALASAVCRTRIIDDLLGEALGAGVTQVVILGAGFDSRAFRTPGIARARVFEVDHPATQAVKRSRLERMLGRLSDHVVFVPIDFLRQELDGTLRAAGYRREALTFFIWEGVTPYLSDETVRATLLFVSRSSAPGSRIVFTYLQRGILEGSQGGEGARELIRYVRRRKEPFTFGFDPEALAGYLAALGLELELDVGGEQYRSRYPTLIRGARLSELSRVALARVQDFGH
jgi:methyltransferase (TIGR00027 family)